VNGVVGWAVGVIGPHTLTTLNPARHGHAGFWAPAAAQPVEPTLDFPPAGRGDLQPHVVHARLAEPGGDRLGERLAVGAGHRVQVRAQDRGGRIRLDLLARITLRPAVRMVKPASRILFQASY
jgi:hypothetical protein